MTIQDLVYASKVYIEALAPFLIVITSIALADEIVILMNRALGIYRRYR